MTTPQESPPATPDEIRVIDWLLHNRASYWATMLAALGIAGRTLGDRINRFRQISEGCTHKHIQTRIDEVVQHFTNLPDPVTLICKYYREELDNVRNMYDDQKATFASMCTCVLDGTMEYSDTEQPFAKMKHTLLTRQKHILKRICEVTALRNSKELPPEDIMFNIDLPYSIRDVYTACAFQTSFEVANAIWMSDEYRKIDVEIQRLDEVDRSLSMKTFIREHGSYKDDKF